MHLLRSATHALLCAALALPLSGAALTIVTASDPARVPGHSLGSVLHPAATTTISYRHHRWHAHLIVPEYAPDTPGDILPACFHVNTLSPLLHPAAASSENDLGDILLSAGRTLLNAPAAPCNITLLGEAKLPTADTRRHPGTGKTDGTLALAFSRRLGPLIPVLTLGNTFPGKPAHAILHHHPFATASLHWQPTSHTLLTLRYHRSWTSTSYVAPTEKITLHLERPLSKNWTARLHALAARTDYTPDLGLGLILHHAY